MSQYEWGGGVLQPKCGEFYHGRGVEMLVISGIICTAQQPSNVETGRTSPDMMPGTDGDPPHGRSEHHYRETVGSAVGVTGDHFFYARPGVPSTTLHVSSTILWKRGWT